MKIAFILNGRAVTWDVQPGEYLLDALRAHHVTSVKKGCDESGCGVCTVLLDGHPILSCSFLAIRASSHTVTTVDGLQEEIEKIANHFGHEGADQCGFCNPGMALTIYALKHELNNPTDAEIKHFILGNLCRCSGYQAQFVAIKKYLEDHR